MRKNIFAVCNITVQRNYLKPLIFLSCFFCFVGNLAHTQTISGTVTDYFSKRPLDAVTVQTSSGRVIISDSLGRYNINVNKNDSVWFSYLNKRTVKYSVDTIAHPQSFDVALYVDVRWLPEVRVKTNDYKLDSIANRQTYAKAFNYRKPGLKVVAPQTSTASSSVPTAVGLDLDELINAFRFKRNRQLLSFQQRLLQEEHDKYIDHRYTKYLVIKLTRLQGEELNKFMLYYRPTYEEVLAMNDLELGYYIEQCFKNYEYLKTYKPPAN